MNQCIDGVRQATKGWQSWSARSVSWTIIFLLVLLGAAAVVTHLAYENAAVELVIERDRDLAYLSAARVRDEFLGVAEVLMALGRRPEIYRRNVTEQRASLQAAANRLSTFDAGVVLLDNFGRVRASVPERPFLLLDDWSDRPFFRQLLVSSDVAFSPAVYDTEKGQLSLTVGVPILGEKGEFVGALAGTFDLTDFRASSFHASIARLRIGQSGSTYLIDSTGRILYDSNYAEVGAMFDAYRSPAGANRRFGGAERTRNAEGRDVIAAYAPVPGTGWMLVMEQDWAAATQSTRSYADVMLALLAAGIVIPAAGVLLLRQRARGEATDQARCEQADQLVHLFHQELLSKQVPMFPGWTLTVHHRPAKTMGGDFYDCLVLPDGRVMLAVGDVGNSSVSAVIAAATTRAALRSAAQRSLLPNAALALGNELLCPDMQVGKGVSAAYAILDPSAGRLQFAAAGYGFAYHRGSGGDVKALQSSGEPLGASLASKYAQQELTVLPGECVVFVSDGVLRTHDAAGEAFGPERLCEALQKAAADGDGNGNGNGNGLHDFLLSELRSFAGGRPIQDDDITIVSLTRIATGVEVPAPSSVDSAPQGNRG